MHRITNEFHFSASHLLLHLPDRHQRARLHGHHYVVIMAQASATLNTDGFVRDYGALKPLKTYIPEALGHRHLNDVMHETSTGENMAWHFMTGVRRAGLKPLLPRSARHQRPGQNFDHEPTARC